MNSKKCATVLIFVSISFFQKVLSENPFIVGGGYAKPGEFPYQVLIVKDGQPLCGGAILHPYWIITAAHCFLGPAGVIDVVAGSVLNNDPSAVRRRAARIYPNQDYKMYSNDIALIQLSDPLPLNNSTIKAIRLPVSDTNPGTSAVVTGWGYNTTAGQPPTQTYLKKLYTVTTSNYQCQDSWKPINQNVLINCGNVCTFTKANEGTCNGDSGSPLVDLNSLKQGNPVLIGLVSGGIPCARGVPDVFTRVWSFLVYIRFVAGG